MNNYHLRERCRASLPFVWGGFRALAACLIAACLFKYSGASSFEQLFRDIASAEGIPVHQGLFSQLGIMVWSGAMGVLLFVATAVPSRTSREAAFIRCSLFLTSLLALDDAFLLHESVFGQVFGVSEKVTFGVYGLLILGYLYFFSEIILTTQFLLLVLALALFGLSVVVDLTPRLAVVVGKDPLFLLEDGSKLAGIVFWAVYHATHARRQVNLDKLGEQRVRA